MNSFFLAKLSPNTPGHYKQRFIFDLYDDDKDGYIDYTELFDIMKHIVVNNLETQQLEELCHRTIVEVSAVYNLIETYIYI